MRDLRFIQQNTKESIPKDLVSKVRKFHEKGKAFNEKHKATTISRAEYEKMKDKTSSNTWKNLKKELLAISKGRCPICEDSVNGFDDIEHFRPKEYYWWLAYDYKNYYPCCALCNRYYKGSKFPLFTDFQITFETRDKIDEEKPLLFNPRTDDPSSLFELVFAKYRPYGEKLKIHPLSTNSTDSYEYQKAAETIKIFNLNGEIEIKNSTHIRTRKDNAERLFPYLHELAILWKKFKKNRKDYEIRFFNKLQIVRELESIHLEKLIIKGNYKIDMIPDNTNSIK